MFSREMTDVQESAQVRESGLDPENNVGISNPPLKAETESYKSNNNYRALCKIPTTFQNFRWPDTVSLWLYFLCPRSQPY